MTPAELAAAVRTELGATRSPADVARVDAAMVLATHLHRDQQRAAPTITTAGVPLDGSQAYVVHPLRNALRIIRYGETDPDIIIAAVLHDTVEDQAEQLATGGDDADPAVLRTRALQSITAEFGERVAGIVEQVSNPLPEPGLSRRQKRKEYAAHVESIADDYPAFMVKAADFVDNALGLHHHPEAAAVDRLAAKYRAVAPILLAAARRHQRAGQHIHPDLMAKLSGAETYLAAVEPG
jgi:(p)ppGpp synthase/HD superfamily hydrolase